MVKPPLILIMVGIVGEVRSEESSFLRLVESGKPGIKVFIKNFPDGELKEEYQYYHHPENNKRIKEGKYTSYFPDGEYMEVGRYKKNKKDGVWIRYPLLEKWG